MKRIILIALILLSLWTVSVYAQSFRGSSSSSYVPRPQLMYPITEEVDLTGKSQLEFRWSPHKGLFMDRRYCDFSLYKGYNMVASTLILKERVPYNRYNFSISSDAFENNQIYTWSLRAVSFSAKSQRSYQSFRVTK